MELKNNGNLHRRTFIATTFLPILINAVTDWYNHTINVITSSFAWKTFQSSFDLKSSLFDHFIKSKTKGCILKFKIFIFQ